MKKKNEMLENKNKDLVALFLNPLDLITHQMNPVNYVKLNHQLPSSLNIDDVTITVPVYSYDTFSSVVGFQFVHAGKVPLKI